jgi:type I site-specific restriction endonuclease
MPLNESDTRAKLIDPILHQKGWTEDLISREETEKGIVIINGKPVRKEKGRVDYLLRVRVNISTQPLTVALVEAKKEDELPPKVFLNAGAASKTNLLFFTKGELTKEIWYYDLSDLNITKDRPLTIEHFNEFFKLLPNRESSERSWKVSIEEIEARNHDIKAVNPNRKDNSDKRSPEELIDLTEREDEK